MSPAFKQILELLPQLSDSERSNLGKRLLALGSIAPTRQQEDPNEDFADSLAIDALLDCLRSRGLEIGFVKAKVNPDFLKWANALKLGPAQLRGLMTVGYDLLADYLKAISVPLTPRSMAQHSARVPALLERAFPGYASMGLLGVVVRKRK